MGNRYRVRSGRTPTSPRALLVLPLAVALLAGCTSDGGDGSPDGPAQAGAVRVCGPGDRIGAVLPEGEFAPVLRDALAAAGFVPDVRTVDPAPGVIAGDRVDALLASGARVVVLEPAAPGDLQAQIATAESLEVPVVVVQRPSDVDGVDVWVAFDAYDAGRMQALALLSGLTELRGSGPHVVELLAGDAADPLAMLRFNGAMEVLQPRIDEGALAVPSARTSLASAAVPQGSPAAAGARIDALLQDPALTGRPLDGVLAPTDDIAAAVLQSAGASGAAPVTTGLGAGLDAMTRIGAGTQYSTLLQDPAVLAEATAQSVARLCEGLAPQSTTTYPTASGTRLPMVALDPVPVTAENAATVFADDPARLAALQGAG